MKKPQNPMALGILRFREPLLLAIKCLFYFHIQTLVAILLLQVVKIIGTLDKMTEMNIKVKSMLAKWLLISTLFAGRFGVNMPAGQFSVQQQKTPTECVFSPKVKSSNRSADYGLHVASSQSALKQTCERYCNAIFAYERLSKVKFDQRLRQPVSISTYSLLHHIKTIPQSSGGDIDAFLIG